MMEDSMGWLRNLFSGEPEPVRMRWPRERGTIREQDIDRRNNRTLFSASLADHRHLVEYQHTMYPRLVWRQYHVPGEEVVITWIVDGWQCRDLAEAVARLNGAEQPPPRRHPEESA
jgi:hypothetical protein